MSTSRVEGGFTGDFESHVTVRCDESELARLGTWAAGAEGVKLTHIVLGRGRVPSQPMLTITGSGTLADQHARTGALERRLEAAGFTPVRTKIEASPWTAGVPQNRAQVEESGPEGYFEHHVKVRLSPGFDWRTLADVAIPHGAHVSWNARRVLGDGGQERFVTQRCHGIGNDEAGERVDALCAALRESGEIVSVEREFVVFDSDASVDDGWIEEGAGPE
ncbi:hypothetical protein KDL01_26180 [Actinospica durhamensis]|uniref:Ankyrin n=1 Tax=Actinospica durhamensis TaxID=1508375 RepID=A0A941ETK9_9ACTN|nr:hypothetical protein [Actinospica durhamensis]MBR7836796.1 hypothetical protein [Actinospica durhamensis]